MKPYERDKKGKDGNHTLEFKLYIISRENIGIKAKARLLAFMTL